MSDLEDTLLFHLRAAGLPEPEREVRFSPTRRFRFDFAWPDLRLACEVEGGTYSGGRHTRGSGFAADCEKYNLAMLTGWRVLRVTAAHIESGQALAWIEMAINDLPLWASDVR